MSLNSQWFQKYTPSKLKKRKKVRLSKEIEDFSVFSNLTIFGQISKEKQNDFLGSGPGVDPKLIKAKKKL